MNGIPDYYNDHYYRAEPPINSHVSVHSDDDYYYEEPYDEQEYNAEFYDAGDGLPLVDENGLDPRYYTKKGTLRKKPLSRDPNKPSKKASNMTNAQLEAAINKALKKNQAIVPVVNQGQSAAFKPYANLRQTLPQYELPPGSVYYQPPPTKLDRAISVGLNVAEKIFDKATGSTNAQYINGIPDYSKFYPIYFGNNPGHKGPVQRRPTTSQTTAKSPVQGVYALQPAQRSNLDRAVDFGFNLAEKLFSHGSDNYAMQKQIAQAQRDNNLSEDDFEMIERAALPFVARPAIPGSTIAPLPVFRAAGRRSKRRSKRRTRKYYR